MAPLAAIAWWQLLIMIRPGYGNLAMGDPYRPELYRWALRALTVTILLAWYLALRRRIGPETMAIGALLWPVALGITLVGVLGIANGAAGVFFFVLAGLLILPLLELALPTFTPIARSRRRLSLSTAYRQSPPHRAIPTRPASARGHTSCASMTSAEWNHPDAVSARRRPAVVCR